MPWCQGGLKKGGKGLINSLEQPRDRERERDWFGPLAKVTGAQQLQGLELSLPRSLPGLSPQSVCLSQCCQVQPPKAGT